MKTGMKVFLGFIALMVLFCALSLGFGWFGVFQTKTVGKAQQNAQREVFEQTQSYVEGKRQELTKYHHEWMTSDSLDKITIEFTIRQSFANFDENKIVEPDLYDFLKRVKYN